MKRLLFPFIVLIALILVGSFVYQAVSGPPKLLQMQEGVVERKSEKSAPKVQSDFSWEALSEEELDDLLKSLQDAPTNRESFSAILAPGESLITEGVEKEPGIFEFSQLTAETLRHDGRELIAISSKRLEVTVGGGQKILSMPRMIVLPGAPVAIESGVKGLDGKMLGGFKLEITAEKVRGGISVNGVMIDH